MVPQESASAGPPIRYFRAEGSRHPAFVVVVVTVLVLALGAGAAWGLGLLEDGSSTDLLDVGGAPGDLDGTGGGGTVDIDEPIDGEIEATSMAMVGDSITRGSADAIRYVLTAEGFAEITVDAETSRRIEDGDGTGSPLSGVKALYGLLADDTRADVWVIALGTNDVGQYDDPADYRRLITTIVDMVPGGAALVWVDVFRFDRLDDTVQYNEILRDVISGRDDSTVVSWFDHAANADEDVLRSDGVHPNDNGNVVFAQLVAEGIAAVT